MEISDNLGASLPYILFVVFLLLTLLVLVFIKRGKDSNETKICAHCHETVEIDALVCPFCNRKVY